MALLRFLYDSHVHPLILLFLALLTPARFAAAQEPVLDASHLDNKSTTLELGIDRPGPTYASIVLPEARPELCREACFNNSPKCKSFTYIRPLNSGSHAVCYLKEGVPEPVLDSNAVSGTTQAPRNAGLISGLVETNLDRPGHDYDSFELEDARPELCREACLKSADNKCKAFTYVKPGNHKGWCYLKDAVPSPVINPWTDSGVINAEM
ncbi:PAN domain-containing protein [Archangium violaceum]|uniref:PAN domain-containing protein n=1 Tax=Archangium violaceum TaxID=83451 RepID=UPI00194E18FB|nr:PAN domain-containing protein [Archangium violaceum]QRO01214.1 PAN domain-containing protein [Archangium violaceum]